jgi:hypothetical protein
VENDIQQRTVHLETTVVVDESQFPEPVHEEANSRARRADHLGEGFLTDLRDYSFRNAFLAEMSQQQQNARKSLFAGVEELVDQIFFVADVACQQVRYKEIGKRVLAVERAQHRLLFHSKKITIRQGLRGPHAYQLTGQRTFAEEVVLTHDADGRFLSGFRNYGEAHFTLLHVKDRVGLVSLGEYRLLFWNSKYPSTFADRREECIRVEVPHTANHSSFGHVCFLSH